MQRSWTVTLIILVLLVPGSLAVSRFSLAALNEPGQTETFLASKAKRSLVARGSRQGVPYETSNSPESVTEGDKLYGAECALCHGMNARTPTDAGRWMYPRAANLTSAEVQGYSNQELFWIVKNGIRLSGMPAFGKVESDEHIWSLVHYLRSLNAPIRRSAVDSR